MRQPVNSTRRRWAPGLVLLVAQLAAIPFAGAAEHRHGGDSDWLFFLGGQALQRFDATPSSPRRDDESLTADILYTHSRGRFRVLAETEVSTDDHEIERLQLGWEVGADSLIWAGRFHQPSSAWNTEHHHGQYLQTAITRPNIEHWEDEGGLLPQHIAGVLAETRASVGDSAGIAIAVGGGVAPVIAAGALDPVRILHSNSVGHRGSWSGRVAFLPELLGEDSIGVVYAHHQVAVLDPTIAALFNADGVTLNVAGLFGKLARNDWRLQASLYHVDARLGAGTSRDSFTAGYLQAERELPHRLTAFARLENSVDASGSRYVQFQAAEFELRRALAGLRWDFARRQALTLEAGHAATLGSRFSELRLQWSGVLP